MGPFRKLCAAVLLAVSVAGPGLSCAVVFRGEVVGPNFRVEAKDRDRPVKGVPIELHVETVARYRAVTDKNGIARFHNLPAGSYFLIAGSPGGLSDATNIEVKPELSERTISVRWPNATPLVTASLKGTLYLPKQTSFSLEVLKPISGRVLKSMDADEGGSFDFPGIAPGLYLLRVIPPGGEIPVDVEPGAATAHLDLDLGSTDCGFRYMDRKQCPQTDLHLRRLEGSVLDPSGAAIPDAEILLRDPSDKLVKRIQTDRSGNFLSLDVADGIYQLVIAENGFTPMRRTLTIEPNGASSPLEIQLGLLGLCSSATTR